MSASDLSGHLACAHLTELNLLALNGAMEFSTFTDPLLEILQERGLEFERNYLEKLKAEGKTIIAEGDFLSAEKTIAAMREGVDVIYQANLRKGLWWGRADFLVKVDTPSELGNWSYRVIDAKLARETRTGTILQLCLYSEMIAEIQGAVPQFAYVITPEMNLHNMTTDSTNLLHIIGGSKEGLRNAWQSLARPGTPIHIPVLTV